MEVTERGNAASSVPRFRFIYQQPFCSVICLGVRLLPDYLTPPSDINAPVSWYTRQADATKGVPGIVRSAAQDKHILKAVLILTHMSREGHYKIILTRGAQRQCTHIVACLLLSREADIEGAACLGA